MWQTRLWRLKRWINMRIITEFEVHTGSFFMNSFNVFAECG